MEKKEAFSAASRLVREEPENAEAHLSLAQEFLALGIGEENHSTGALRMGLTEIRKAYAIAPDSLPVVQTMLTLAAHLGSLQEEITMLSKRAKENPQDEVAREGLKLAEGLMNAGIITAGAGRIGGIPEIVKMLLFSFGELLVVIVFFGMVEFKQRDLFLLLAVALLFLYLVRSRLSNISRASPFR